MLNSLWYKKEVLKQQSTTIHMVHSSLFSFPKLHQTQAGGKPKGKNMYMLCMV